MDEVKSRTDYEPWMDILTADRIMTYGGVPYDRLAHASVIAVEKGLRAKFGPSSIPPGDWFGKLRSLFPPTGQVKNFLNAAVVAHQVPNGGTLAIVGSRYAQGSGDWVYLLAKWLSDKGRSMTIHCFDPNENRAKLVVGTVTVIAVAQAVERDKLCGYSALVDDVYVAGVGYDFSARRDAPIVSYKMRNAEVVNGVLHKTFLHTTEARYFSFPRAWELYPSCCACERCKIEAFLDIGWYSDLVELSPCRSHLPEQAAMQILWQDITLGIVMEELTPVYERARILLSSLIPASHVVKEVERIPVDRVFGYSPAEVPFSATVSKSPWYNVCPTVVTRPGTMVASIGVKICKTSERGWVDRKVDDGWRMMTRPTRPVLLMPGAADIYFGGCQVTKKKKILVVRNGAEFFPSGKYDVETWCFLHQSPGCGCGFSTAHLEYPLCTCGHRHGAYQLRQWGVDCGSIPIKTYEDVQRFLSFRRSKVVTVESFSDLVCRLLGDPIAIANYCAEHEIRNMAEFLVPPRYFFISGRWWYYPWELFRGVLGDRLLSKEEFLKEVDKVAKVPWPNIVFTTPSVPVRIIGKKFTVALPG